MGKKIVAVGTTAIRTLESLPYLWRNMNVDSTKSFDAKTCNYWNSIVGELGNQQWIHNVEEK